MSNVGSPLPYKNAKYDLSINFLKHSCNPYLLQHADHPVYWQMWSQDVLDIAEKLQRPLLISIGYSTCHWCHVLAEESFQDQDVADLINYYFIAVKVDREERPDLDSYYMNCAHLMEVSGGWPLNVFANPKGIPFWICTYAPPVRRYGMASFKEIVNALGEFWNEKPDTVSLQVERNASLIGKLFHGQENQENEIDDDFFMKQKEFIDVHQKYYDREWGGFKFQTRVKFPNLLNLIHLLTLGHYKRDISLLLMVVKSTFHMLMGGIYDHLGGGLFRYSTDYEWKIPHFEKMLYDNALFLELLANLHCWFLELKELKLLGSSGIDNDTLTYISAIEEGMSMFLMEATRHVKNTETTIEVFDFIIVKVIDETVNYWNSHMSTNFGKYSVFYAAQDAGDKDSEGEYYSWNMEKINDLLDQEEIDIFLSNYTLIPFSSKDRNLLIKNKTDTSVEHFTQHSTSNEGKVVSDIQKKLVDDRSKREAPFKDKKILLSWNAMMAYSYLILYQTFLESTYLNKALSVLEFIHTEMLVKEDVLLHDVIEESFQNASRSTTPAFLNDYAQLVRTVLKAYEVTNDKKWLDRSVHWCRVIKENFQSSNGFSEINSTLHDTPIDAMVEAHDGVEHGSQSLLANNFLYMDLFIPHQGYRELAVDIFKKFYESLGTISLPYMLSAFYHYQVGINLISLFGDSNHPILIEMREQLTRIFLPSHVIFSIPSFPNTKDLVGGIPRKEMMIQSLQDNVSTRLGGKKHQVFAVVCSNTRCSAPIMSAKQLMEYLQGISKYDG